MQALGKLVSVGVVDNGNAQAPALGFLEWLDESVDVLRRAHELNALGAALDLFEHDLDEPFGIDIVAAALGADFMVLTEAAAQVAVRKEDRPAPCLPEIQGLLPGVKIDERYLHAFAPVAEASLVAERRRAVGIAAARTEIAGPRAVTADDLCIGLHTRQRARCDHGFGLHEREECDRCACRARCEDAFLNIFPLLETRPAHAKTKAAKIVRLAQVPA